MKKILALAGQSIKKIYWFFRLKSENKLIKLYKKIPLINHSLISITQKGYLR